MKRWVGLDPSLSAFGYAVLYQHVGGVPTCIDVGTWKTKIESTDGKFADRARRVRELGMQLVALLEEHDPVEAVYIEGLALGMKTSHGTVQTLGRVRGLVEGICLVRGLEIAEVAPATLKHVVTGRRNASKDEVARVVLGRYGAGYKAGMINALDDNATDALAVAHVGAYRHGLGMVVSSGVVDYRRPVEDDDGLLDF